MPEWTHAVRRADIVTRHRAVRWTILALIMCAAYLILSRVTLFHAHPIAILSLAGMSVVWFGRDFEGVACVTLMAVLALLWLPRFPALPFEVVIFVFTACVEWGLLYVLRHAYHQLDNRALIPRRPTRQAPSHER